MEPVTKDRWGHYPLLVAVAGLLFLPNLGSHTLWDVDEAHNAECTREMIEADDWIIPTFNFSLRPDKPILLYWLMRGGYAVAGVNELGARLGSALCGLLTVLTVYELGRRLFDARTGLLAGVIVASSIMFNVSAHAATPDALLILWTAVTFLIFWDRDRRGDRNWLLGIGITTGMAVLAKGPVGVALPAGAIGLFLIWERRLGDLLDRRLIGGLLLLALVAVPWYLCVGVETKWEWWRGFFLKHNVGRFSQAMEGHSGSPLYHPVVLLAGLAPWSAFLGLAGWYATGSRGRADGGGAAYRFLWCWALLWLVFFSLASTKLPNYQLPAYPAWALLTARFLERWRTGAVRPTAGWMAVGLTCLAGVGVALGGGMLAAAGTFGGGLVRGRVVPELAPWAAAGLLPVLAAAVAWWLARQDRRGPAVAGVAAGCVAVVALLAAVGPVIVADYKAAPALVAALKEHQVEADVRLGCLGYYQPSLVFYSRREVRVLHEEQALDYLHAPCQCFLVIPERDWEALRGQAPATTRIVARRRDLVANQDVLLLTNVGGEGGPVKAVGYNRDMGGTPPPNPLP